MFELTKGIRSILEACEAVKPGEKVLVIADNEGGPMWVGQAVTSAVNLLGAEAVLTVMTPRENVTQEPPAVVAAAMKCANATFVVSDRGVLALTTARKEATAAGARFYIIHRIPVDDLKQGVSAADIRVIKERTETLAEILTQANVARITTALGTDLSLDLTGREGIAVHPMSHILANLPYYAEAAIAPVEGTAEGVIVADLEVVGWEYLLREPLRYTVKAGKVIDVSGGMEDVQRLREIIATDENAANIAELGIGTSHIIPWPMHGTRRDAARIGTAHIAIGRNDGLGGKTWSHIHEDNLMSRATVQLDNRYVLRDGVLLI